ncbi:MAG TPA: YIP1 family protein, partial [Thermoanaerobaculia bacterium]|nr:YIP1 family protein [Thermoanaerobaculia bacterium]
MAMEDSSFGRLLGALVSPGKTFRSIAERPTWAAAFLVLLVASGAVAYVVGLRTDYRDVIVQSVKEKGRDIPEAQLEPQINMMEKAGAAISGISVPLVIALVTLLAALFYWVAFKLLGADFSYKSSLAVCLHAGLPGVISALLTLPVVLSHATLGYADVKSGVFLKSNLAFLAPQDAKAWVTALYASADFFSLWSLVLSIIGYKALSRLTTKPVAMVTILIWLLFIGVRV